MKRRKSQNRVDVAPFHDTLRGGAAEASPLQLQAALRVRDQAGKLGLTGWGSGSSDRTREQFMGTKWATPYKSREPEMAHIHNAVSLANSAEARRVHAQAVKKRK